MERFTEDELLTTINDMGYDLSPAELIYFKNEMDHFLDELESGEHPLDGDVSFKSLKVSNAQCNHDEKDGMWCAERYCCVPSYEGLNLQKNQNDTIRVGLFSSESRGKRLDHNEIIEILDHGYRCLRNITEESDRLRGLNDRFEQRLRCSGAKLTSFDECQQVLLQGMDDLEVTDEPNDDGEKGSTLVPVDPVIRPVLWPLPGGVPFRHDPVKMYEMYKKEWAKYPLPGENKRLTLRWKVREFMLRRDVSRAKADNLARRRISNPDWSPRPYLD